MPFDYLRPGVHRSSFSLLMNAYLLKLLNGFVNYIQN
jgi:hypothetical protein